MQLSQKRKIICNFFLHFPNLNWIINILRKKVILIADVFLKERIPKKVAR